EGLLPYLSEPEVHALLDQVASLSAEGSTLALDCVGVDPFSQPGFAPHAERLKARGIRMISSCADPAALLAEHGFQAHAVGVPAMAARTGRAVPGDPLRGYLVAAIRTC